MMCIIFIFTWLVLAPHLNMLLSELMEWPRIYIEEVCDGKTAREGAGGKEVAPQH